MSPQLSRSSCRLLYERSTNLSRSRCLGLSVGLHADNSHILVLTLKWILEYSDAARLICPSAIDIAPLPKPPKLNLPPNFLPPPPFLSTFPAPYSTPLGRGRRMHTAHTTC
jgi:hypothetical protein